VKAIAAGKSIEETAAMLRAHSAKAKEPGRQKYAYMTAVSLSQHGDAWKR
jgi:hypothetical protein